MTELHEENSTIVLNGRKTECQAVKKGVERTRGGALVEVGMEEKEND